MFSFCASASVMFGELDDIFLFRGCTARAMRYYIRNTRIMQGIEGYEHAGNPETRLARLPFPLSRYVPRKASTRAIPHYKTGDYHFG
jgi:hypothetical protein